MLMWVLMALGGWGVLSIAAALLVGQFLRHGAVDLPPQPTPEPTPATARRCTPAPIGRCDIADHEMPPSRKGTLTS